MMPSIPLAPRLRALPDLGAHELHGGALTADHVGHTIAVRTATATVIGPLSGLSESRLYGRARVLVQVGGGTVGELTLGLHPAHPVTVLPAEHALEVPVRVAR